MHLKEIEERFKKEPDIDSFILLIKEWYKENYEGFRDKYDLAVKNVVPIPSDQSTEIIFEWKDASIDKLCNFFMEWYNWNPTMNTALKYVQRFSWLYYRNPEGLKFVTTFPGNLMTEYFVVIRGRKMDSPESEKLVSKWIEELGVDITEYKVPEGGYRTLNEFFSRELKESRKISEPDDDSIVVSPADAIINMIDEELTLEKLLPVKTQKLNILQLLNNSKYAQIFDGGTAVSCILMPDVYHHFHSPVTGEVIEAREDVIGNYFGIDDYPKLMDNGNVGNGYDYSIFESFRRGYLVIKTEKYGYVAMIPVGLTTIASVMFKEKYKKVDDDKPVTIKKGDEVGYFKYGGSLNILLFEKGCFPAIKIPQGQMIGKLKEKS